MPPTSETFISGVVLAAGTARRMNGDKLLLEIDGRPIVREAVEQAVAASLAEIVVVVREGNAPAIRRALEPLPACFVENPHAAEGMGTSVALGAASVSAESAALLLLQADQPFVGADMLRALIDAWREAAPAFVASRFGALTTTPVLFDRALFAELRALYGDRGARAVLARHAGRTIDFPEWRGADVDTPDDYVRARRSAEERRAP